MDVRDGFIAGIFNYCDQWCSACEFTSRCRGFALDAELEARGDPSMRALVDAPRRREEEREPPGWLQRILDDAQDGGADAELFEFKPSSEEHWPLEFRAEGYALSARDWLQARGWGLSEDPADPMAVIRWFATYIPSKVRRATSGLANDEGALGEFPADHDGSAKAALVGIARSHAAWTALVGSGTLAPEGAERFVTDLAWLERELERVFPKARSFVRPGFDEPEAVAQLEAGE